MSDGYGSGPVPPGAMAGPESLRPPGSFGVSAPYGARVGAAIIDFLVKVVIAVVILIAIGSVTGIGFLAGDETSGYVAFFVAVIMGFVAFAVAALFYEPLYMASTNGKTLGKQVTGCRVVRIDGRPMTFGWAFLREVVVKYLAIGTLGNAITAGVPVASLVDNLWPLWDSQQRALHDLAVETRVIRD